MAGISKLTQRFEDLEQQLSEVLGTKYYQKADWSSGDYVDHEMFLNWSVKAKHLIEKACGEKSLHAKEFEKKKQPLSMDSNYDVLVRLKAVFEAAREDFEGGYCESVKSLVQAELFDNELDQARQLLSNGYHSAAAVIAGVVLETTLRQLCVENSLPTSKLDKMNADLAKAGIYNLLMQKRITALADIRNNAAHGKSTEFRRDDVSDMIEKVEAFITDYLN